MQFRWIALIALWTLISGPIFGPPAAPRDKASAAAAQKAAPTKTAR
jgi:hypothetical protein